MANFQWTPDGEPTSREDTVPQLLVTLARLLTEQNQASPEIRPTNSRIQTSMQVTQTPTIEHLPIRALPHARPDVIQTVQSRAHQQALTRINELRQQNLERQMERNTPRQASNLSRGIAETHSPVQTVSDFVPSVPFEYRPQVDSSSQTAFQNLLNSAAIPASSFIQEDQNWIQGNLAHAGKPVNPTEYLRNLQVQELVQQQAEAQAALIREQIELARAQQKALQLQQWTAERQAQKAQRPTRSHRTQNTSSAITQLFTDKRWLPKVQRHAILSDQELKQLFHDLDVKRYSRVLAERKLVAQAEPELKRLLAWNMSQGPNALKNKDGYIIIGNQAYGSTEAYSVALKDMDYFQEHDQHLPPLPYPVRDDLSHQTYPNVTRKVQEIFFDIRREIKQTGFVYRLPLIIEKFPNGEKWDLQVNHELPGQVVIRDIRGEVQKEVTGKIKTQDQYALFKGQVRRAGYISNYAFGYGMAAAEYFRSFAEVVAHIAALPGRDGDNPQDIQAIRDGWDIYWREYPEEWKPPI